MEVHHHSHAPSGRKKWKHYFWEFLMLFLAVFCGFLAEYQLEHRIEKDRARQYIRSFYKDLQNDTIEINERIEIDNQKQQALSTVHSCFDTVQKKGNANPCLTIIIRNAFSFTDFIYNDRTIQQLKNSGGLRLLKKEDADSIVAYDNTVRQYLDFAASLLQERQTTVRNSFIRTLSFNGLRESRSIKDFEVNNNNAPYLLTNDEGEINRLFNEVFMYHVTIRRRIFMLSNIRDRATSLLNYLKLKYDLK